MRTSEPCKREAVPLPITAHNFNQILDKQCANCSDGKKLWVRENVFLPQALEGLGMQQGIEVDGPADAKGLR